MPKRNNFQHQRYAAERPTADYDFVDPELIEPENPDFTDRLSTLGQALDSAGVDRIYLLHGTFAGTDSLGLLREFSGVAPGLARSLSKHQKEIADSVIGETGNFTHRYASLMRTAINANLRQPIDVRCFDWSSENHHTGRAEAAVQLIAELGVPAPGKRILLLGHSHAGNVFALATNLFGADPEARQLFFEATKPFFENQSTANSRMWLDVRNRLESDRPHPFDFVTFGTPVRYGWDTNGFDRLLHFVHHRPAPGLPEYLAKFPSTLDELLHAKYGDFVQRFGIAGTNFFPYLLRSSNLDVEQKLSQLLQPHERKRDLLHRLRYGVRVHQEGVTLLANYPNDEQKLRELVLGHGVYTRPEFLVFHMEEIVRRIY